MLSRLRWKTLLFLAFALVAVWFTTRWIHDTRAERQALAAVRELGGTAGSIRFLWAREYRFTFHGLDRPKSDLERLTAVNPLAERYAVGIMFRDTTLTRGDIQGLRAMLPNCVLFRVHDNQMVPD